MYSKHACWILAFVVSLMAGCERQAAAPAPQAASAESSFKFQALNIGRSIAQDGSVAPTTLFLPSDKIVASIQTEGASKTVPMQVRLIAMSNGGVLSRQGRNATADGPTNTNFVFKRSSPWPLGRYIVEAEVDGKLQASQPIEVLAELPPNAPKPQ